MNRWKQNHQPDHGRIVQVSDGTMSYWTPLDSGEKWKDVAKEFSEGYDHGDVAGDVECKARLIVGGDEEKYAEFAFDENGKITKFKVV